jgi:hypothetical protein
MVNFSFIIPDPPGLSECDSGANLRVSVAIGHCLHVNEVISDKITQN